jgi:hypothetical protein
MTDVSESGDLQSLAPEEGEGDATAEIQETWTSDAEFSLDEARGLTSHRGITVVMLMGEAHTGKSTVIIEIWTDLMLEGRCGDVTFGGSANALAFEERAFYSRLEAGEGSADTARTQEEHDGFLHLRVKRADGVVRELLFADYAGEHFRSIREGTPLVEELQWAGRVDRFLLVIDGEAFDNPETREVSVTRSMRLLYALGNFPGRSDSCRLAVLLTKEDALRQANLEEYSEVETTLLVRARMIDPEAVTIRVAARPKDEAQTRGLSTLIEFLSMDDRHFSAGFELVEPSSRAMGRFRA